MNGDIIVNHNYVLVHFKLCNPGKKTNKQNQKRPYTIQETSECVSITGVVLLPGNISVASL